MNEQNKTIEDPILKLPITKKAYELYRHVLDLHDLVPKRYRNYLWKDMYSQVGYIVYHIIKATKSGDKRTKRQSLERASEQLGMLRITIHLTYHVEAISSKLCQEIFSVMDELGPMLGGFIRSIRT